MTSTNPSWRRGIARLWNPNITVEGGLLFWRVRLLQFPVFLIAGLPAVLTLAGAILLHQPALARASFIAFALYWASKAVYLALRLRFVLTLGRWTGLSGEPIRRFEERLHFWIRTSAEVLVLLVCAAAAVFLTYMAGFGLAGRVR